jgi:hypothetical protein
MLTTSRQNDIVLRRELKAVRDDVANVQVSARTNFSDLQTHVTSASSTVEQQISAAIESSKQATSASFDNVQESLASGYARLGSIDHTLDVQADKVDQSLKSVSKTISKNRKVLCRQQKVSTSKLMTRLNDVHSLTQQIAIISLTETANNDIIFEGQNLGAITLPLMLMETDLIKAIRTLMANGTVTISPSEARWIQEEFENLLACGHEAAALSSRRRRDSRARSRSHADPSVPTRTTSSKAASFKSNHPKHNEHHALVSKFRTMHRLPQRHQFYTAAGILVVETDSHDEKFHQSDHSKSSFLSFRIWFLPKLRHCSVSVAASFSHLLEMGSKPKITRLVQSYNVIRNTSPAITYASTNNIAALQNLFLKGKSSPNDCNEEGVSLLMVSTYTLSQHIRWRCQSRSCVWPY